MRITFITNIICTYNNTYFKCLLLQVLIYIIFKPCNTSYHLRIILILIIYTCLDISGMVKLLQPGAMSFLYNIAFPHNFLFIYL